MVENRQEVRVLAVLSSDMQGEIRRQLNSLGLSPTFVSRADELGRFLRNGEIYQVALLPAALSDTDWWTIWGELAVLSRKPAVLVYAHTASFQLWSGVLDAGGYDVIVEPFTREKLKEAVLRAARSFDDHPTLDGQGED